MKLFVGLGNPGDRYADTRHNVGWMALDAIAAAHGFAQERAKFQGRLAEGTLAGEKVWLLKPLTYMNLSGQSVGEAARFLKIAPGDIVVFHDEIDLAPGKLRVKHGGGHAGHNGLRSLHQHVGPDFSRVRIGVGKPSEKHLVADYVLHPFHKTERAWLDPLIDAVAEGAPRLAAGDLEGFQSLVALRTAPPKPPKPERSDPRAAATPAAEPSPAPSPFDALRRLRDG